jgi:hypothetical protein
MKRVLLAGLIASVVAAETIAESNHEWDWGSRARYANVDANNSGQSASLLVRGNLHSHWRDWFDTFVEVDAVGSAFKDDHSDGVRFNGQPLLQDPPGTEFNQAFATLNTDQFLLHLGRQRINLDNQRFVGGNGFWQNEQTFDALFSQFKLASNSRFTYSYIANANRIFGEDADKNNPGRGPLPSGITPPRPPAFYGDHEQHTHLTHVEWNEWDYTRVTAYAHRMENLDMPAASNATYGASYSVNYKIDRVKYRVQLEAAQQDRFDLGRNQLPYYLVDAGIGINTVELIARYEVLGENDGVAFITPLGSNHKFEGWAGVIGNTPNTGVRTASLGVLWRASPIRLETHYLFFKDDVRGQAIGEEWDVDIAFRPIRKHNLSLRLAHFEPDNNSGAIRKVFLDYAYNL